MLSFISLAERQSESLYSNHGYTTRKSPSCLVSRAINKHLPILLCAVKSEAACYRHNLVGSTNLMEAMRKHNVKTVSHNILPKSISPREAQAIAHVQLQRKPCFPSRSCWKHLQGPVHVNRAVPLCFVRAVSNKLKAWLASDAWLSYRWCSAPHVLCMGSHLRYPSTKPSQGKLLAHTGTQSWSLKTS